MLLTFAIFTFGHLALILFALMVDAAFFKTLGEGMQHKGFLALLASIFLVCLMGTFLFSHQTLFFGVQLVFPSIFVWLSVLPAFGLYILLYNLFLHFRKA